MTKEKKCADLVHQKYKDTLKDYQDAFNYFKQDEYQGKPDKDYEGYKDFFDYVNQSGLSFDFVEANTFKDQKCGYWRFQMSWGGPSVDGASIRVSDDVIYQICQMFLECSEHPEPYQYEAEEVA